MMKKLMRSAAQRAGLTILKDAQLPYGLDLVRDVQRLSQLWGHDVRVIFDVGANVGQSALRYCEAFPHARVFAFEPGPETFKILSANVETSRRVKAERLALGQQPGEAELHMYELSVLNSLTPNTTYSARYNTKGKTVSCRLETLDNYCAQHNIERLDLLKIDTEGSELAVLQGAKRMLASGAIRFVYAEFNEVLPMAGVVGGALLPLAELLTPLRFKFVATYTDWIETEGEHFVVSNVLFVRR